MLHHPFVLFTLAGAASSCSPSPPRGSEAAAPAGETASDVDPETSSDSTPPVGDSAPERDSTPPVDSRHADSGVDTAPPPLCPAPAYEMGQEWDFLALSGEEFAAHALDMGPGIAVGDLDGDGWLDAVATVFTHPIAILRNDGTGQLVRDETVNVLGGPMPTAVAPALADVDADGDLDIFLSRESGGSDYLLLNSGDGVTFTAQVLRNSDGESKTGSFGDGDGDGDLDLFVAGFIQDPSQDHVLGNQAKGLPVGEGNHLYLQDDNGRFVQSPDALPAEYFDALTYEGAWIDADLDGDLDLYLDNDYGNLHTPNVLLMNDGAGHFTRNPHCGCELAISGMGVALGDANHDGVADMYLTDWGRNHLLLGFGDGTFYDGTYTAEALPDGDMGPAWGTHFVDVDQDGDDDLIYMVGAIDETTKEDHPEAADGMLLNDGDGTFSDFTELSGFGDRGVGRSVAVADLDRDGRPDMVTAGIYFVRTWLNRGGCEGGVTVSLDAGDGNSHGIGARVVITIGDRFYHRWMYTSTTYGGSTPELYIGLGGAPQADRITVFWPGGQGSTAVEGVPAGERLHITP